MIIRLVGWLSGKRGGAGLVAVSEARLLTGWVATFLELGWPVGWPVVVAWLNGLLAGQLGDWGWLSSCLTQVAGWLGCLGGWRRLVGSVVG